jgi:cyclophilin family peptidyl-prolyl cis-trans isomerase
MDLVEDFVFRPIASNCALRVKLAWCRALVVATLATWLVAGPVGLASADTVATSTLVNFNTSMGSFQVDLYDPLVGTTVTNFLGYVNSSAYSNTVIHRLQKAPTQGIGIVQGGGFTPGAQADQFTHIANMTTPPTGITLQDRMANLSGTISMARTGNPNTATSEWFFNTVDDPLLDGIHTGNPGTDRNGYAVFGQVMAGGMPVVNSIYNLPVKSMSVSADFPLRNWSSPQVVTEANYVFINSISVASTHPAFTNPNIPLDVNNDGIVSPADANSVINNLILNHGIHSSTTYTDTKYRYVDTTANGVISAADAVKVINYLITHTGQGVSHSLTLSALSPQTSVPEPSSWILGIIATAALAGLACRRRRWPRP